MNDSHRCTQGRKTLDCDDVAVGKGVGVGVSVVVCVGVGEGVSVGVGVSVGGRASGTNVNAPGRSSTHAAVVPAGAVVGVASSTKPLNISGVIAMSMRTIFCQGEADDARQNNGKRNAPLVSTVIVFDGSGVDAPATYIFSISGVSATVCSTKRCVAVENTPNFTVAAIVM